MTELIEVEVVYAQPGVQRAIKLRLPFGSTVRDAITASGLLVESPEIDLASNAVGIYGKVVNRDQPLRHQDRVEIYRPLQVDPMDARRLRAQQQSFAGGRRVQHKR